ncbi:MAG: PEP-CTERM sorting domain-containing protein [Gemmatimonadales bacterium]|nr:PEP-CTERM sorting domain-containing protein [Gemmatimonadales bacterium]
MSVSRLVRPLALLAFAAAAELPAQVTYAGGTDPFLTRVGPLASFRGRNMTDANANQNFFWGKGDLGVAGNRRQVQGNASDWSLTSGIRQIDFRVDWDHLNNHLTMTFPDGDFNVTGATGGSFADATYPAANQFRVINVGSFNGLLFDVRTGCGSLGAARLVSMSVNGGANLLPGTISSNCASSQQFANAWFTVNSASSWFVNGRVEFDPSFGNNEGQRFDWKVYRGTVVPEPSTYVLMASGLALVGMAARRRQA